jgi:hypothetical protein
MSTLPARAIRRSRPHSKPSRQRLDSRGVSATGGDPAGFTPPSEHPRRDSVGMCCVVAGSATAAPPAENSGLAGQRLAVDSLRDDLARRATPTRWGHQGCGAYRVAAQRSVSARAHRQSNCHVVVTDRVITAVQSTGDPRDYWCSNFRFVHLPDHTLTAGSRFSWRRRRTHHP